MDDSNGCEKPPRPHQPEGFKQPFQLLPVDVARAGVKEHCPVADMPKSDTSADKMVEQVHEHEDYIEQRSGNGHVIAADGDCMARGGELSMAPLQEPAVGSE